jgi:hypothetical protein
MAWWNLGSPELFPSIITLLAYDDHSSHPKGLFQNVLNGLGGKMVLIDLEVVDSPLDYNIIPGCCYMYAMKVILSLIFCTMMFPCEGKSIFLYQLMYYEP